MEELLDLIVQKKWYVEISGISMAGDEKILFASETRTGAFCQGDSIFTAPMVREIKFHANGCTIILKH
jgi:hypothetical protein